VTLQVLHGLTLFLTAALLVRLWREGLHLKYKAFFAALAFELVTGVLIYLAPQRRNLRAELFFVSTAIGWVFRFLVLRELCLLVFNDHPGIKAAVRIGIRVSLALAVAIPLTILALAQYREMVYPILEKFFLFHQSATFFLTVLFAGTVAFVAWFPVALRRNIVLYCLGFSIKFFGESAVLLFRNATISAEWRRAANMVEMTIGVTAVLLWLVWLNREGEAPLVSVGQLLRPGQTGQALLHLDRINRFLSATLPKSREQKHDLKK
jgi:hypothetical protein